MTSGVEGRTTILSLADEGSQVRAGEVVCELDATAIVERRIQQSITVSNAQAALVKAKQAYEIQRSQNRSDINRSRQATEFAAQDLRQFLEGEREFELQQGRQAIDLAQEEAQRTRDRLTWSEKLNAKGFLTSSELEADRIAHHRGAVMLEQATRSLDLLERFRMPRREAELRAALEEAQQEGERVELQAAARLVDFEANLRTCEATLELEQQKLARLDTQVERARMRAPRDGYIVYAQRDNDEPPIDEGVEVREREEILSIPSSDGMIASVKLHETVLKQVVVGQTCVIKVDALPGVVLDGRVEYVAMLPDQNSRWSNPNLRLYGTTVAITTQHAGLRPGMSCAVEILIEEIPDTTYVPVQAVFRERERSLAFVSEDSGVRRRDVRVGRFNELWVQVLDGLEEDEIVLLHVPPGFDAEPSVAPAARTDEANE
jgi:HlyD family secretion protein